MNSFTDCVIEACGFCGLGQGERVSRLPAQPKWKKEWTPPTIVLVVLAVLGVLANIFGSDVAALFRHHEPPKPVAVAPTSVPAPLVQSVTGPGGTTAKGDFAAMLRAMPTPPPGSTVKLKSHQKIPTSRGYVEQDTEYSLTATIPSKTLPSRSGTPSGRIAYDEYRQGSRLTLAHNFRASIPHYHRALTLDPDLAEAHNNLAISLYAQGDYSGAINEWRRSMRLKMGPTEARRNLAIAFARSGITVLPLNIILIDVPASMLVLDTRCFGIFNLTDSSIYGVGFDAYTVDTSGRRVGRSIVFKNLPMLEPGATGIEIPSLEDLQKNGPTGKQLDPAEMPNLHIDITFFRQTMGLPEKVGFLYLPGKSPEGYWRWVPQM